jgi:putative transposase
MKKSRFSPKQIVTILAEFQNGKEASEIARERCVSEQTLYNWRKKYGGMDASELKRLNELQEENTRLKKMYAELSLDHELAKEIIAKKL